MDHARQSAPALMHHGFLTSFAFFFCLVVATTATVDSERAKKRVAGSELPIRDVRVRIASGVTQLRVRSEAGVVAEAAGPKIRKTFKRGQLLNIRSNGQRSLQINDETWTAELAIFRPATQENHLVVSIKEDHSWSDEVEYPGTLHLSLDAKGQIQVLSLVDVETYVACVVARETWPSFLPEAYCAQAIASRTYVLFHMLRRQLAPFDVSAGQGSQVYQGIRNDAPGRKARKATARTRGLVCTWNDGKDDRLFCSYFSAACGGVSQSASIFDPGRDVVPLRGSVRCDYCKNAPKGVYRWGPITMTMQQIRSHLVARYPELASLGAITGIEVIDRNEFGRPLNLRITGRRGKPYDIMAERFRLAIGGNRIRSTDFTLSVGATKVTFEDGKGYGHGLGMCQWGSQGQAHAGKRAGEILHFYYPGSKLTRVY